MNLKSLCLLLFLLISFSSTAQEVTKWRGPNSNGIYPETGLLKEWPSKGPSILWHFDQLGEGYSSPVFCDGKIYVTGMIDTEGFVFVLSKNGSLLHKFPYGTEFHDSYPGSRSSPAIAGDLLYMLSGMGRLVCMNRHTGENIWSKELFETYDGRNIRWGITETLLIDGDKVYCVPGGTSHNVLAFDRLTGKLIWTCKGKGDVSAYCTPLLVELEGRKLLITMTANNILGIDAENGELLWSYEQTNRWSVHANTPVYHDGAVYCFSGYGKGGVKLNLNEDGSKVSKAWTNKSMDSRMGGAVLIDGYIYASGDQSRSWQCIDWSSGEQVYESTDIAKGVVIAADGMLYCYSERGELALVEATPKSFNIISETKVSLGSAQHWAHPVIDEGVLYVRHGDVLIAYEIK